MGMSAIKVMEDSVMGAGIGGVGGVGMIGGMGGMGAMGGMTAAVTSGANGGAGADAQSAGISVVAPPGVTVNISDAAKVAFGADGAGAQGIAGALGLGGAAGTPPAGVDAVGAGSTINLEFNNVEFNLASQGLLGAGDLDKTLAALLLALLIQQQNQGNT